MAASKGAASSGRSLHTFKPVGRARGVQLQWMPGLFSLSDRIVWIDATRIDLLWRNDALPDEQCRGT